MKKSVKTLVGTVLLALSVPSLCLAASVVTTGSGITSRMALKDAMRMAVEQEAKVAIDSRSYARNYQLIEDKIYTHAEGYITHYRILDQRETQGQYFVTIQADVSERLNSDLITRFDRRTAVGSNLQDPRVGVIVLDAHGKNNRQAENALIRCLRENGFTRIIDLAQMDASLKRQIASAAFQNQFSLIQSIQTQFPVDYIVTAQLSHTTDSQVHIQGFEKFRTGRTQLDIRMLNVNTAEVLFADSVTGTALHSFGDMAQAAAINKAVDAIQDRLAKAVMEKATNPEQHIQLVIIGNLLGNYAEACNYLSKLPNVNNVYPRSVSGDSIRIDVNFNGTAGDFMTELEQYGAHVIEMTSEYIKIG